MKNITISILTGLLLFTACRKPHFVDPSSIKSWKSFETIDSHSKNITNSFVTNNTMYLSSSEYLIEYLSGGIAYRINSRVESKVRRPMSSRYYSTYNTQEGRISINSYSNNVVGLVSPKVVGKDFTLATVADLKTDFAAYNTNRKQLLVTVLTDQGSASRLNYLLVNFSETSQSISIDSVQIIEDLNQVGSYLPGVYSYFEKFFVAYTNGLVLIDENGAFWDARGLPSNLYLTSMYQIGASLFLVSRNDIYLSNDRGENWRHFYQLPYTMVERKYFVVDDELIVVEEDKLSRVRAVNGEITFEELPSDGLENNIITGVAALNQEVFVSTYSGTFSKSLPEFIIGK